MGQLLAGCDYNDEAKARQSMLSDIQQNSRFSLF